MHLYDVFYWGRAMDSNTQLPAASADIEYATNTNWDRHTVRPVKMANGSWEWARGSVTRKLYAPPGFSSTSPEGQQTTRNVLAAMKLISSQRSWAWELVATLTMRSEDESDNRATLPEGWRFE